MSFFKSLFDGKKESPPPAQEPPASVNVRDDSAEDKKKKRIGRTSLYLTPGGAQGDLTAANTSTGRVLGN